MKNVTSPSIVGHRGARGNLPENSRASYQWAIDHGAAEIETDSRLTLDGIIVQYHNPFFLDSDGNKHQVADSTYDEIKAAVPDIMTLSELIEFINRRSRLMLEIKPQVPTEKIIATIRHYLDNGWKQSDFSFASFDYDILKQVHAALPEIDRIVLEKWSAIRALNRAKELDTQYLSMDQQFLWWGFIRWAAKHNHKIYTYPSPRTKLKFNHRKPDKWVKHGLHGIITDKPENYSK
jgi:glycerophosphoryl diester phosphodiesterase